MTRLLHVFALLLLLPTVATAQWSNEPSGSTVLVDCPMVSVSSCGMLDVYNAVTYGSDAADPVSPSSVAFSTLAAGATSGGSQIEYSFTNSSEMFVGMVLKINSQFQGFICCASKMWFMRGAVTNGFFGVTLSSPTASTWNIGFGHNTGGGLDNSHICPGGLGLGYCTPNVDATNFAKDTFIKFEVYMKRSTTSTSRDGILKWWANGTLRANYTTLNYPGGFNNWVWTETYGGADTVPNPRIYTIGHVRISIPNCPLGCTPPPPGPPPPPASPPPPPPSSGDYVFQSQFSGTQGGGQWSYRDTDGNLLTYNAAQLKWEGNQLYLAVWNTGFHHGFVSPYRGPVVRWTAHENGTAHITGNAKMYEAGGGATFKIKHNSTEIYSQGMTDQGDHLYDETEVMTTGEYIDFILVKDTAGVNNNTMLNPTISWTTAGSPTPTISGFSPSSGAPGTVVTITGTNFIPSLSGQTVTFSNIAASVTAATATSITAVVPSHALTGTVKVITVNGTGTSGSNFTVPLSGVVETVADVTASALSSTSATVHFTALSDGTGAAAKHDVRLAAGVISWGEASSVASGTCSTPYTPGVTNTVVTCTITGLTTGTQYDIQLVAYKGTPNVDAVYSNLSNIATVTPMGTITDGTEICRREDGWLHPVSTRACFAPMPPMPPLPAMQ